MSPSRIAAVALLTVASVGLAACDGSNDRKSSTPSATESGSVGVSTVPSTSGLSTGGSTAGTTSVSPPRSTGSTYGSPTTSTSRSGGATSSPSIPPSAPRPWRTYQPLPTSAVIGKGTAMRLLSLSFDALDGGWTLRTQYRAPTSVARGQIIYFALVQGGREGDATPFRLQRSSTFTVFMAGTKTPRPSQVLLFQAKTDGSKGSLVLRASIPAAAFTS